MHRCIKDQLYDVTAALKARQLLELYRSPVWPSYRSSVWPSVWPSHRSPVWPPYCAAQDDLFVFTEK